MAMGILGKKEAVDPLLAILKDPGQKNLHDNAMDALSMIGDDRALPIVRERLKNSENPWPWTEMRALGRIDTDEARAVAEDYLGRMTDTDNFFSMAGHYLSASRNEKVVEMVIRRARADPGNNWWSAVYALGRVRTPAADAALEEYARDASNPQRQKQAQGILDRRREADAQMAALETGEPPR
jgi:HEAT repeat protein